MSALSLRSCVFFKLFHVWLCLPLCPNAQCRICQIFARLNKKYFIVLEDYRFWYNAGLGKRTCMVNFPCRHAPILCKHTCIIVFHDRDNFWKAFAEAQTGISHILSGNIGCWRIINFHDGDNFGKAFAEAQVSALSLRSYVFFKLFNIWLCLPLCPNAQCSERRCQIFCLTQKKKKFL